MATVKAADIQIRLCSVPELGLDYNNTLDFKTKTNQLNYFSQRTIKTTTGRISVDGERQTLFINSNLDEIKNCDYLYMPDEYGKYFFYFITGKSYKTSSTTKLDIEIDVFQTYLFDFELLDSFIERTHVHRWTETGEPYINLVDEGMEIGPYHIEKQTKIYPLSENYVITATNPLGTLGGNYPPIDDEERIDSNPDWGSKPDRPIPTPPINDFDIPGGDGSEVPVPPPPFPTDNDGVPITYNSRTYYTNLLQNYYNVFPWVRVAYGSTVWSYGTYTQLLTSDLYKYRNGTLYETDKGRKVFLNTSNRGNSLVLQKGNGIVPDEFKQYMDDGDYGNWIVIRYGQSYGTNTIKILITYLDTINYNTGDTIPAGIKSIGTVSDKETVGLRSRCFILAKYIEGGTGLVKINEPYAIYTKLGIGLYKNNENINEYPNTTNSFEPSLKFPFKCGNVISEEVSPNKTLYCQIYETEENKSPKIISPISGIVVANGTTGTSTTRGTAENVVFIKREDGLEFRISGLSQINVTVGQDINIGDVIGLAGKEVDRFSGWSQHWNNYNFYICAIQLLNNGTSVKYSDYSTRQFFQPPIIGSTGVDYHAVPIIPPTEVIREIHKEDLDKFYIEDISKDPELYHMFDIINEQNEEKQKNIN